MSVHVVLQIQLCVWLNDRNDKLGETQDETVKPGQFKKNCKKKFSQESLQST